MRMLVLLILFLVIASASIATNKKPRFMDVVATAYCPCDICCAGHSDGRTATMRDANLPGVAVDPKIIRLGARLDIPGYGTWIRADDVGGAIKGSRIDVRFKTHQEAEEWGRRRIKVRVWD